MARPAEASTVITLVMGMPSTWMMAMTRSMFRPMRTRLWMKLCTVWSSLLKPRILSRALPRALMMMRPTMNTTMARRILPPTVVRMPMTLLRNSLIACISLP